MYLKFNWNHVRMEQKKESGSENNDAAKSMIFFLLGYRYVAHLVWNFFQYPHTFL